MTKISNLVISDLTTFLKQEINLKIHLEPNKNKVKKKFFSTIPQLMKTKEIKL